METTDPGFVLRHLQELQNAAAQRTQPPPSIGDRLTPPPRPSNDVPFGQQLYAIAERINAVVRDANLDQRIVIKVARAFAEKRIPESELAGVLSCVPVARNRGAYFVAAAKRMFTRCQLAWHTEDWQ